MVGNEGGSQTVEYHTFCKSKAGTRRDALRVLLSPSKLDYTAKELVLLNIGVHSVHIRYCVMHTTVRSKEDSILALRALQAREVSFD